MRFLHPFDEAGKLALTSYLSDTSLLVRERKRFTMILLSATHRMPIVEIAQSCAVSENTVKKWFNRYEAEGFPGLLDRNMNHQKSSLSAFEEAKIMACIADNPQNLNQVAATLADQHQLKTNKNKLKRFLKKKEWTWRRVRKSLKEKRDEVLFRFFETELVALKALAQSGEIDLWFADESSFHLNPHGVYAWQPPHTTLTLPAQRDKAVNVLGFINLENQGEFYDFEGNMNTELFIQCVEDFILQKVTKKTILIIDKSSTHYSNSVQLKCKEWKQKQLFIQYLPSYSSELNYIEILWKQVKHHWLSIKDWVNTQTLKEKVLHILRNFGKEYTIQFKI